jgi:hypothetical protein
MATDPNPKKFGTPSGDILVSSKIGSRSNGELKVGESPDHVVTVKDLCGVERYIGVTARSQRLPRLTTADGTGVWDDGGERPFNSVRRADDKEFRGTFSVPAGATVGEVDVAIEISARRPAVDQPSRVFDPVHTVAVK